MPEDIKKEGKHTIKVDIQAETRKATQDVIKLDKKLRTLGNLSSYGSEEQRGFLSKKQVKLYKTILKEMESSYKTHYDKLIEFEKEYTGKVGNLQKEIEKRQKLLNNAKGGNRWGDVANPKVIEHHERKLKEAIEDYEKLDVDGVEEKLDALKDTVEKLGQSRKEARPHIEKINSLHQENPVIQSISKDLLGTLGRFGSIASLGSLFGYIRSGKSLLRQQEYESAIVGQKLSDFEGDDQKIHKLARTTGLENQYKASETLQTQGLLLSGGTYSSRDIMNRDTIGAQGYGRAYGTDPNSLTESFTLLRKMGAMDEGEMQRFAEIIGGTIAKGGMKGREEELLRATTSLASIVSNGLVEFKDSQLLSITKLQTEISEEIPELKGERGADMLSRIDSSIKNGGNVTDILLGKGTRFKGLEGMYELKKLKEEGISNPLTLQYVMEGLNERLSGTPEAKGFAASEALGISLHEWEALRDTGIADRVAKGDFKITEDDEQALVDAGYEDLVKQIGNWDKTNAKKRKAVEAEDEKIRTKTAKPFERISTGVKSAWHNLPDWLQVGTIFGGAIGGSIGGSLLKNKYSGDLSRKATKTLFKNIGDGSKFKGFKEIFKNFDKSAPSWVTNARMSAKKAGETGAELGGKLLGNLGGMGDKAKSIPKSFKTSWKGIARGFADQGDSLATRGLPKIFGDKSLDWIKKSRVASWGDDAVKSIGKGMGTIGRKSGKIAGKVPIVGTALNIGIDRVANPEHNWGRSISKGVGSAVGTVLGTLGAGALSLGTSGVGTLASGGLIAGGSIAGEKLGNSIYSLFAGKEDLEREKAREEQKKQERQLKKLSKKQEKEVKTQETLSQKSTKTESRKFGYDPNQLLKDSSKIDKLDVGILNLHDRNFKDLMLPKANQMNNPRFYRHSSNIDSLLDDSPKEHIIKVVVEGNIDGMTDENQDKVADSLSGYFKNLFSFNQGNNIDLSIDQVRR